MTTTAAHLLTWHRTQLGYREVPQNFTKYGKWYGLDGQPWCDMYQSYGGAVVGASDIIGHFAYTPSHAQWFQNKGRWGHEARVGAIAFYSVNGVDIDHVGIVETVYGPMDFIAIEGNSNVDGSQNGYEVCRVHRRSRVVGFGYPLYTASTTPPPSTPTHATLRLGSRGTDVKLLQEKLHITADGIFGPQTDRAVRSFQSAHGLVVDGIVGNNTWNRLL